MIKKIKIQNINDKITTTYSELKMPYREVDSLVFGSGRGRDVKASDLILNDDEGHVGFETDRVGRGNGQVVLAA